MDSDIFVTLLFFLISPFANLSSYSLQLLGLIIVFQFYYMAKGLDTMVQDSPREEVTVSDGLQLGRSIADQTDTRNGENEGNDQTGEVCGYVQVLQQYLEALPYPSTVFANCGVHIFYDFKIKLKYVYRQKLFMVLGSYL